MTDQPERIVVVGGGLAGLHVVESLRTRGYAGHVTLLGAEGVAPYDRPPLSKEVLLGGDLATDLRAEADLLALGADLRFDEPALSLDAEGRVVRTARGEHPADAVVLATGAVPRRVAGIDGHLLRTREDADSLRTALAAADSVAVVGAGLIGCEVAAAARARGARVDLYDVLAGPMIRVVGATVARVVADLHRAQGVAVHTGVTIGRHADRTLRADDRPIEADVVVEAVGGVPDVAWLAGSGLTLTHGVVCDEDGRAAEGVFAVGDVASWAGHRSEHWTAATTQADHVAARILGQTPQAAGPAYWWSDQYGLKIQGLGSPRPDDDAHVLTWGPKERTVAVYSREGRLTGAVGFGAPAAVMRLGADITAGTDVAEILERLTAPAASTATSAARPRRPAASSR
jgi:3-phenylpropionate/trans-cinnamate dioxygenase ferredoxin reductase component